MTYFLVAYTLAFIISDYYLSTGDQGLNLKEKHVFFIELMK